jgi:hypothetical protein
MQMSQGAAKEAALAGTERRGRDRWADDVEVGSEEVVEQMTVTASGETDIERERENEDGNRDRKQDKSLQANGNTSMSMNINGITAPSRLVMLEAFLNQHEVDIALLQEVVCTTLSEIRNYETHLNIGTNMRGTAILVKYGIVVEDVK